MTTRKSSRSTEPTGGDDPLPGVRLQKLLSAAGVASRRKSEELIEAGRVSVDGAVVTEVGIRVDPATALVTVDGVVVSWDGERRYLLANKPAGYVTTVTDTHGRPTVMDLVSDEEPGLFPVGRLDLETEGVLLLTDDGELAHRLTHPRYHVPKTYRAHVRGVPDDAAQRALARGVELNDGRTAPAEVGEVTREGRNATVVLTLREGKKRQVRRMLEAVGHPVGRLVRVAFGPLDACGLDVGDVRALSPEEVSLLREGVGLAG